MARADSLGQFEQWVLTAILSLREDAYGVTIHPKVQDWAGPKSVAPGGGSVTLDRLEDKGLGSSWLTDPTPEGGGRARRCYRLEVLGEQAWQESAATAKRIWDSIVEVWGKERGRAIFRFTFIAEDFGLLRLAVPAAISLTGLMPADAYANPNGRSGLPPLRRPSMGITFAVLSQAVLTMGDPQLAIPLPVTISRAGLSFLLLPGLRLLSVADSPRR